MKKTNYFLMLCAFMMIISSCSLSERHETSADEELKTYPLNQAIHCHTSVIDAVNGIPDAGNAYLTRTKNGVSMNFNVEGLVPGYAYTIWWVIWNNPENCGVPYQCGEPDFEIADAVEVEVLYATGHVIGASGTGNFAASLKEGKDKGSINDLFGLPNYGGLADAQHAEIHLVLRSHGPAIPGVVNEQINTYPGGCEVDFLPFTEIPDEEGECGDYMFAVFATDCGV